MHRAFAAWLVERPWRAAVVCAFLSAIAPQPLSPFAVASGAIPVLMLFRTNVSTAFGIAGVGAFAGAWALHALEQPLLLIALPPVVFVGPVLSAFVVQRTRSLNFAYQIATLATAVLIALVFVAIADPVGAAKDWLQDFRPKLVELGIPDADSYIAALAARIWGMLGFGVLATVLSALFLGRWWASLSGAPGSFGAEFRGLRLGVALGIALTVILLGAAVFDSSLLGTLCWIAFTALAFQGLAAAHRRKAEGKLKRGALAALYVLLILIPLSGGITVILLAIWGFIDNWLRPRAHAA